MFGVIEVGSTNTKGYICENDVITEISMCYIEFKNNYKKENRIIESDLNKLYDYINKMKEITIDIHIYGTSIFRQLNEEERVYFLNEFKKNTGYDFNIVSSEEENEYTVYGVINNIDYKGKIAVMIGGGGSTELSIVEGKKIIEQSNSSFGAMDIIHKYPDLSSDKVETNFEEMLSYTKSLVNMPNNKADILVLSGGNYLMFYQKLNYPLSINNFYSDSNQPYYITNDQMRKYDVNFFYNTSLDEVRNSNPEFKDWWSGTRGMRLCVTALVDILNVKYIVPTKISMVYGIVAKIKEEVSC